MELKDFLPIPELEGCRTMLCIQPHPDDNEVGAGATIARLASLGCRIVYLTVTNGNMGSMDPSDIPEEIAAKRRLETLEAAALLGVADCRFLDYDDGSYPDEKKLCMDIAAVIREVRPEIVMTVDPFLPYEVHPDHLKVGMAAAQAFLLSPFPHFSHFATDAKNNTIRNADDKDSGNISAADKKYEPLNLKGIAFYSTAYPNTYINVSSTWDLKLKAIEAHKSQFSPDMLEQLKYYFDYKAGCYGAAAGFERAEVFKVLSASHLHMNVDTVNL